MLQFPATRMVDKPLVRDNSVLLRRIPSGQY